MVTADSLFNGRLTLFQAKDGYRFSLDAILLAGITRVRPSDRIVDLGTGCGVIPLILAYRKLGESLLGLELQPELVELARRNIDVNGLQDQVRLLEVDFREVSKSLPAESADLVVSNPPYRRLKTGRINPDRQRAVARHELTGSVVDVFEAASHLLAQGGRLAVIYPAVRLDHLIATALRCAFRPKELTIIYSNALDCARLVHLECRKGGGEELRIAPPFFIYGEDGQYSEPMRAIYEGASTINENE